MPGKQPVKKANTKSKETAKPKAKPKAAVAAAPVETTAAPTPRRHYFRQFLAGLCVLLACVSLVLSVYSVFLQRAILNTDVYTANMTEIIKEPVVKKAVSKVATEELFTALDVQKRIVDFLPAKVKFAGGPASAWLQGFAQQEIEVLLGQKQFQDIWVTVNRSTHKTIVSVLRGEPGNITLADDGSVYVDILPIVKDLALQFTEGTKIHDYVAKIPAGANGAELRVDLGKALSISLPKDFGRVKVVQAAELIQARRAVAVLEAAAAWLPWATIGFMAGAIVISAGRRKTIMELALGIAAAAVIGGLAVQVAVKQGLLMVADDTIRQLISVIVNIEVRGLPQIFWNIAEAGAIVWIIAFIAGQKKWFVSLDNWVRGYVGYATPEDLEKHPLIKWINVNINALRRWLLFISIVVLLIIGGWWGVAIFGALLLIGEAKLRYLTGWKPFG
jgi:hypothetical protein